MNISYNRFNGLVSKDLAVLDTLNMTMLKEQGIAVLLNVTIDRNSAIGYAQKVKMKLRGGIVPYSIKTKNV